LSFSSPIDEQFMEKDSLRSWIVIFVLSGATSIAYVDRVLLSVAAPLMMTDLKIDGASTGILLSAFFWSYTLMQIPAGWMVDRYGPKRVLAAGYLLWTLSSTATGWITSYSGLLLSRLGLGIGEAPVYPACYNVVAQEFSERHRGLASAIYADGAKLGPALGAPLAAWLITLYGWRTMFVIVGVASLSWLVAWWGAATPRRDRLVTASPSRANGMEVLQLLKTREMWGIILGWFGYLYVFFVYVTWLPGYLVLERGFTILKAGWYSSLPFIVQFAFSLVGGWASDRSIQKGFSPTVVRKSAIALGLTLGTAIVPAALADSDRTGLILFLVALAGMGIASANMFALPPAIAPIGRSGLVGAIQNSAGALGGVLAPILTGALYDRLHSFTGALLAAAGMLAVSGFGYLIVLRRIEPMKADDALSNRAIAASG
jgi:ACS family D-galactonate transporter-like MFS transporter